MYKTIFTYLHSAQSADLLSGVTASLGETFGASVIGAHNSVRIVLYGGIPSDYLAQHNQFQREEADAIEASFRAAVNAKNLESEWRHRALVDNKAFEDIVTAARCSDLIVASGKGEGGPLSQWNDLPVRLILESGRPVLLLPEGDAPAFPFDKITIAWNHTKEAARATFDAMPLLKLASQVRVVAVNSPVEGTEEPSEMMAAKLCRHGVKAEAVSITDTERSDGETLLAEHQSSGADLLVMGCYGHSRLREMVLGGASKHILEDMTTPILMAH